MSSASLAGIALEHSHNAIRGTWLIVGLALGAMMGLFVAALCRAASDADEQVERSHERFAEAVGEDIRAEIQIPRALSDRMWRNIEPRLPK